MKNYFEPSDGEGWQIVPVNKGLGVIILCNGRPVTNYAKIPRRLIDQVAEYLGLSIRYETSYATGRTVYRAGWPAEDGGIITAFASESRAAFNRRLEGMAKCTN